MLQITPSTSDLSNLMGLLEALLQNTTSVPWRGNVGEGEKNFASSNKKCRKMETRRVPTGRDAEKMHSFSHNFN